jgi:nucleotide-binding universal stress UspA family protein
VRNLIVGYEESDEGRDALALGRLLAGPGAAGITIVHVTPDDSFWMGRDEFERAIELEAATISRHAEALLDNPSTETRVIASGGSPARVLTELAEEEGHVDAIVIGSTRRGALGRVMFGSVGERLLHGAPCPVAVAPRGFASGRPERPARVGVAYVATAEAALALAEARKLSAETGASLRFLTVVPPVSPRQVGLGPDAHRFLYEAHERDLDAAINELRDKHGVEAEGRLLEGNPVEVLSEQSADELDLLLIGSRGYGPVRRVLLGAVSAGVMRKARCPVIVVPRSASRAADGSRTVKEKATA